MLVQRPPDEMTQQRAPFSWAPSAAVASTATGPKTSCLSCSSSTTSASPRSSARLARRPRSADCRAATWWLTTLRLEAPRDALVGRDPAAGPRHRCDRQNGTQVNGVDAMVPTAVRDGDEVCSARRGSCSCARRRSRARAVWAPEGELERCSVRQGAEALQSPSGSPRRVPHAAGAVCCC